MISLDAEKVFDRIKWPYLFHMLHKYGLGEHFIKWVKLLYHKPLSAVRELGEALDKFAPFRLFYLL